jgi:uncharacterized membrane protein YfcA
MTIITSKFDLSHNNGITLRMISLDWSQFLLVGLAAFIGGAVNALAGGGTLITFPMLTAVGIPAVAASVTNTVALCPGYLGATIAQWKDLQSQKSHLWLYAPASVLGGVFGGFLLLHSGERLFRSIVPYLILLASVSLAAADPLRTWLMNRAGIRLSVRAIAVWAVLPIGLAAIYGGYFGAGLSVIVLAVLGLLLSDSLTRLNALKQAIAFCVNISAAVFFVFSGQVFWPAAIVMAGCALAGGILGGRLAGRIKPASLRLVVVIVGVAVAVVYLVK